MKTIRRPEPPFLRQGRVAAVNPVNEQEAKGTPLLRHFSTAPFAQS